MRSLPGTSLCLAFASALVLAGSTAAAQQATVTGRISEETTGQPITDARIFVVGTSLYALSGADG